MKDFFAEEYNYYSTDFYDSKTNSIEWIDIETWDRKRLFYNYLDTDFPYIIITANIDDLCSSQGNIRYHSIW